ncbi:MAG TPA: DUF1080 domain-containing protein [Bacteroidales bacterium]|nr:DUF1080 domain-containing protein [Bacteroidales bacterium]
MKTRNSLLTLFATVILLTAALSLSAQSKGKQKKDKKPAKSENIQLFNGKDLSNWVFFLKDQSVDPSTVFTVKDGIINISGSPFGYMRTKEKYSDYKLHVEWRWPSEATNSGVFVHGQEPDAIWLKCIECQLMAGNAGDFVCMSGAEMNERTDKSKVVVKKKADSSEKPVGEWNTMEVICKSNTVEVVVNGVLQNKGTNVNISSGSICLQSEGKDIQFRNVFITKLKK